MFRKLAIFTALLVAGAMLSSVFAELATGKPAPLQAAEECAFSLSDGSDNLLTGFDEEGPSGVGLVSQLLPREQALTAAFAQLSEAVRLLAVKQPLFLLFHAFLFYDHI